MEQPVYLVGPRCVGKSSVGRRLAPRLGVPYIDLDHMYVQEHESIGNTIDRLGELEFRRRETGILFRETESTSPRIIDTGGGAPAHLFQIYRERNKARLLERGTGVYLAIDSTNLEYSAEILVDRQLRDEENADQRPDLVGIEQTLSSEGKRERMIAAKIVELRKRHPHYMDVSQIRIETRDLNEDEVTELIMEKLAA